MTFRKVLNSATPLALVIYLTACGSDSGGINSISAPPTPPPVSAPPPPPPSPPPPPAGPLGLTSDQPFKVIGHATIKHTLESTPADVLTLRYIAADNAYEIALPGYDLGRLKTLSYNGSYVRGSDTWQSVTESNNAVTKGNSSELQDVRVTLTQPAGPLNPDVTLSYTSYGWWHGTSTANAVNTAGVFAYGVPTTARDVPISGTATYSAKVIGNTAADGPAGYPGIFIAGQARLNFDFAAGLLTGHMRPEVCPWDCYALGQYDFTQTVYSTGSPAFSGKFVVPGSAAASSFEGSFNGPGATELMARWTAPYLYPGSNLWGTMYGIWVGKKD